MAINFAKILIFFNFVEKKIVSIDGIIRIFFTKNIVTKVWLGSGIRKKLSGLQGTERYVSAEYFF